MASFFLTVWPLVTLALGLQAHAAEPLVVCVDADNPPFMYVVEGKAAGLYPALIVAAFQPLGGAAKVEAKPWKRCLSDTDEGRAATAGIYKNEERLKKYDFSDPIFVEAMAVYFNLARPLVFTGVADLFGKRVGVIRGWSYGDDFDRAVKEGRIAVEDVKSDAQNFQKLMAGRVDAILAIAEAGATHLRGGQYPRIERSARPLFEHPTFLAFNKSARQGELLSRFNRVLDDMKKSGKFERIVAAELGP